jgi:hypothetical protein
MLVVAGLHVACRRVFCWPCCALGVRGKAAARASLSVAHFKCRRRESAGYQRHRVFRCISAHVFWASGSTSQAIGLSAILILLPPRKRGSVRDRPDVRGGSRIALFLEPIRGSAPRRPQGLFSAFAAALSRSGGRRHPPLVQHGFVRRPADGASLRALAAALIARGHHVSPLVCGPVRDARLCGSLGGLSRLPSSRRRASGVALMRPTPPLRRGARDGRVFFRSLRAGGFARSALRCTHCFLFLVRPGPSGPVRGFSPSALDIGWTCRVAGGSGTPC